MFQPAVDMAMTKAFGMAIVMAIAMSMAVEIAMHMAIDGKTEEGGKAKKKRRWKSPRMGARNQAKT